MTLLLLLALTATTSQAQVSEGTDEGSNEEQQMITDAIDSLTNLLFQSNAFVIDTTLSGELNPDSIPVYPDSVYDYRLSLLASPINLDYNETVRKYIDMYLVYKRPQVQKLVGLAQLYFPIFEQILDKYNLPLEFKYLPVIESALNPHATSRVGATGLWQFMYPTARMYDLTITSYVDERRDPYLATEAAAKYLSDLYKLYGDWSVALAAYNCGPGNVNKAIRRSGGKTTYWEIRDYLPRETRGYVPCFIAATYVMNYYQDHNIVPLIPEINLSMTDTVMIDHQVKLEDVAEYTGVDEEVLAFYNPALRRGVIPYNRDGYALNLPFDAITAFDTNRDSIYLASESKPVEPAEASPQFTSARNYKQTSSSSTSSKSYYRSPAYSTEGKTKLLYSVKSGDNLGFISEWYDVSIRDLQLWNGFRSSRIYVGQKLKVYVDDEKVHRYKNIDNLSMDQKKQIVAKQNGTETVTTSSAPASDDDGKYIYYTIKNGDTLWDLSKKYPKNSVDDLKRINNITDLGVIKPGFVIKIAI